MSQDTCLGHRTEQGYWVQINVDFIGILFWANAKERIGENSTCPWFARSLELVNLLTHGRLIQSRLSQLARGTWALHCDTSAQKVFILNEANYLGTNGPCLFYSGRFIGNSCCPPWGKSFSGFLLLHPPILSILIQSPSPSPIPLFEIFV